MGCTLSNSRHVANQSCLTSPNSAILSQDSAPQMTAQIAITRISINRCKRVRSMRGSSTWAKCWVNARIGEDSIRLPHLLFPQLKPPVYFSNLDALALENTAL